jgi:plastocyanin
MKTALIVIIAVLVLGAAIYAFSDKSPDIALNPGAVGTLGGTSTSTNSSGGATSTGIVGTVTNASSTLTATTSIALPKTGTVTYTDSGFAPKTLIIAKGGTVTFINKSTQNMWVASDPHPTHTGYPGFDAKKSVANGAVYTFTFDKVGSWNYHNHVSSPQHSGTIIVQ